MMDEDEPLYYVIGDRLLNDTTIELDMDDAIEIKLDDEIDG